MPPITTFHGTLRQINSESVNADGFSLLRVCTPYFFPLDETYRAEAMADLSGLSDSVTHLRFQDRQFRRWAGDALAPNAGPELPRERYFSLGCPDGQGDDGTLAEELNAYRNTRDGIDMEFGDLLDERLAAALGVDPAPYVILLVKNPVSLQPFLDGFSPALQEMIEAAVASENPFLMSLGVATFNARFDGVLDLRRRDAQEWFFETFVAGQAIPTEATGFEGVLPELLKLPLGGSQFDGGDIRLQSIGNTFRKMGLRALIYPSARMDPMVSYTDGALTDWRGWNLVLYDGAPPSEALFVDLGGWETEFTHGVRLEIVSDGANVTGWEVRGLRSLNHYLYLAACERRRT